MYIPLNTYCNTFHLGAYDTLEEAKMAYLRYLESHDNFVEWWKKTVKEYKKEFGQIPSDLATILYFELDDSRYEDKECFWDERSIHINGDNIYESTGDFEFVAEYSGWVVGSDGVNTLETLISSVYYHRTYRKFDYAIEEIEWMAKAYPSIEL